MDASLVLQSAPGASPLDEEDHLLEAADAGRARVHHLDLPALALGVLRVHPGQLGREQRGLVAAGPCPDLEEDVLIVVGLARHEQTLELALEVGLLAAQLVDFGLRELQELLIAAVLTEQVAGLAEPAQDVAILLKTLDDLGGLSVFLPEASELGGVAVNAGVG